MNVMKIALLGAFIILVVAPIVVPQSLADIARQEEARRKAIGTPAKVYTNADLSGRIPAGAAAPASAPAAAPHSDVVAKPPASEPKPTAPDPRQDRKYWSERIAAARTELDRSKVFLEALQSRINALTTDFVNRDDPVQRARIAEERQRAIAEFDRLQTEIQRMIKTIADIEEEARRLGVPPGWLR
jgi:hypothetical protein